MQPDETKPPRKFGEFRAAWLVECATGYRSASSLAVCATLLFVASAIADALVVLSMIGQIQLLNAAQSGQNIASAQAQAYVARQRLIGTLDLALSLMAIISLLVWVYRANRNAHVLGVKRMRYSPGWSVGWFLIPVANLFMPYKVLRELWKASTPGVGANWQHARVSKLLIAWWLVWFVGCGIQYSPWPIVTGRLRLGEISTFDPYWLDYVYEYSWGLLIVELVRIVESILTIIVIVSITDLQEPIQWRFGLRALLIATTLTALLPGLAVYASR